MISVPSSDGASHFIQFGPNLQLPSASAGEVVTSVLPQLQDAMRQTVLGFKADDLQTADGINKMRAAMLTRVNEELLRLLGARPHRAMDRRRKNRLCPGHLFPDPGRGISGRRDRS